MAKQIRYSAKFKLQTVQSYLQADLSANQLAINLGIHPHTLRHWIQDFNDGKMKAEISLDSNDILDGNYMDKQGQFIRGDIANIISKIGIVESEMQELKSMLKAYLMCQ